ncbi:MAG TPA: hypothetical protein VKW06_10365 [Candidatus Angelobacter sp.]|nr:hypothetical protein [Candidatus Angelobacter sp.]
MADGKDKAPEMPKIPEGTRYLFVFIGKDGSFGTMFNDLTDALALHKLSGVQLEDAVRAQLRALTAPHLAAPEPRIPMSPDVARLLDKVRTGRS